MLSKYRYCKSRMVAFVDGELPLKARRRVARYIDECPKCYNEYLRVREFKREMNYHLPTFGQPSTAQLDRVWSVVASQLNPPHRQAGQPPYLRYWASYSAAIIVLFMALLLPLAMSNDSSSRASTTPPVPTVDKIAAAATDLPEDASLVAVATTVAAQTDSVAAKNTRLTPQAAPHGTPVAATGN